MRGPLPEELVLGLHPLRLCLVQERLLHRVLVLGRQRRIQARQPQGRVLEPCRG